MIKYKTKSKIDKNIHRIFGINGVLAVLDCDNNYHIKTIEILEKGHILENTKRPARQKFLLCC